MDKEERSSLYRVLKPNERGKVISILRGTEEGQLERQLVLWYSTA